MRTLRVLAILTKRQMADDGPYLVAALLIPVALIFATAVWAFFDNPDAGMNRYLPVPTVCLLTVLVVFIAAGSYVFATRQVQTDWASGISEMLSALPLARAQTLLARTLAAALFLIVVLIFLACVVTGAVLLDLLPGRTWILYRHSEWSFSFLVDVVIHILLSMFLIALMCHCFGQWKARASSRLPSAGNGLLLTLVLTLLVIIKGFTPFSTILCVIFLVGLLIPVLLRPRHRTLSTIAVGLTECILIGVPLFCSRYLCDIVLTGYAADSDRKVEITPSGLFAWSMEGDEPSSASGHIREEHSLLVSSYRAIGIPNLLTALGIVESVELRLAGDGSSRGHWWRGHFDKDLGQAVGSFGGRTFYVGPEGVADEYDNSLGQFTSPILTDGILYDRRSRRFYAIDLENQAVRAGEELRDISWDPIAIFPHPYRPSMCSVFLNGVPAPHENYCCDYLAVLDRSGRIALLDRRTLRLLGWAAHLPRPHTLFGRGSGRRDDVLDCDIDVIAGRPKGGYIGMVVGSLSRQGTSLTLTVFDKNGKEIRTAHSRMDLFESTLASGRYLLECLHPPILTLASFFTAYSFEAGATHRALFFMPNSFVALQRDRETSFIFQFLFALLFLLPALAFAGFLSWRVARDAALMGMSRRARGLWELGTLAFGLPVYITYRLVRPKAALALCSECGRGRRVDQEVCHHCGRGWEKPVLNPPAWRIVSP